MHLFSTHLIPHIANSDVSTGNILILAQLLSIAQCTSDQLLCYPVNMCLDTHTHTLNESL